MLARTRLALSSVSRERTETRGGSRRGKRGEDKGIEFARVHLIPPVAHDIRRDGEPVTNEMLSVLYIKPHVDKVAV